MEQQIKLHYVFAKSSIYISNHDGYILQISYNTKDCQTAVCIIYHDQWISSRQVRFILFISIIRGLWTENFEFVVINEHV